MNYRKSLISEDLDLNVFSFLDFENLIELNTVNKDFAKNIKQILLERDNNINPYIMTPSQSWLINYLEFTTIYETIVPHKWNFEKILSRSDLRPATRLKLIDYFLREFNNISEKSFSFLIFCCTSLDLLPLVFPIIYNRFKYIEDELVESNYLLDQIEELTQDRFIAAYIISGNLYQKGEISYPIETLISIYQNTRLCEFKHPLANIISPLNKKKHQKQAFELKLEKFRNLESLPEEELSRYSLNLHGTKLTPELFQEIFKRAIKLYKHENHLIQKIAIKAFLEISYELNSDQATELYQIVMEEISTQDFINFEIIDLIFEKLHPHNKNEIIELLLKEFDNNKTFCFADIAFLIQPYKLLPNSFSDHQVQRMFKIFLKLHHEQKTNSMHFLSLIFNRLKEPDCKQVFDIITNSPLKEEIIISIKNIFPHLKNSKDRDIAFDMLMEFCEYEDRYIIVEALCSIINIFKELNKKQQELAFKKITFIYLNTDKAGVHNFLTDTYGQGMTRLNSLMTFDIPVMSKKMLIKFSYEKFLQGTNLQNMKFDYLS